MKTLYLIRHSKAISSESGVNDFKRALSKRGIDDAKTMSKRLRKKGVLPDILISSPADRALETAHIFATEFDYSVRNILLKEEIYEGQATDLLGVIEQLDDHYDSAMLFGHEPALSSLATLLLHDAEGIELRTTGVVGIIFDIASWQKLQQQGGSLLLFDFPVQATPKVYKKAKKVISDEISMSIESILEGIDSGVSQHVQKVLKKTSKKLAKELTHVMQSSKVEDFAGIHPQKRVDRLSEEAAEASVESATPQEAASLVADGSEPQKAASKKRSSKKSNENNGDER